ncbi:MAG: hypothetical protein H0W04_04865 [Chthoniobacterales bacterium]|nr:hypothetical protein [Chthoniobacterales bacterium]
MLEHALSEQEHSQILQTIEMFEVITQSQPDDYQSLEILKDAYQKVAKPEDSLRISRKLAEAYFNGGSYTLAMQECELILEHEPNAPEILAMLGEIESRLQAAGQSIAGAEETVGLIASPHPDARTGDGEGRLLDLHGKRAGAQMQERGDEQLAKFIVAQQLVPEERVMSALAEVKERNRNLAEQALAVSLLDRVCGEETELHERVLSHLIDRTKFAYVPMEYYDIDRQVARMLPESLTLGRLFVPFDLISRTIMVACCNPFDIAGREAVQQSLDYTVAWYLARPSAITRALQDIYRLESRS